MVHSVPAMSCVANTLVTNTLMSTRLLPPIVFVGVLYTIVNLVTVKITGTPVYHFLTWQDWKSPVLATIIILGFVLLYLALSMFDQCLKPTLSR